MESDTALTAQVILPMDHPASKGAANDPARLPGLPYETWEDGIYPVLGTAALG